MNKASNTSDQKRMNGHSLFKDSTYQLPYLNISDAQTSKHLIFIFYKLYFTEQIIHIIIYFINNRYVSRIFQSFLHDVCLALEIQYIAAVIDWFTIVSCLGEGSFFS